MLIGYTLPNAIQLIADGIKIHTLREDPKERFKVGMILDHCTGVRTKKFKKHLQNTCERIDVVFVNPRDRSVQVNGETLTEMEKQIFIANDGFPDLESF
nr:hypothetical protein [uncultured Fluviicola sp.]